MPNDHIHDPQLLDALEALTRQTFDGEVWRVTWASRDSLVGGTGGGRWHPPNDFEALYTSMDEDGALAEIYHHLSKAPVFSSSHATLNRIRVKTNDTLVFNDINALVAAGVEDEAFRRGDHARTREIGAAARFLDADSLIVPSARWDCANLVLFLDRLADRDSLQVIETREINWPAWRERSGVR